MTAFKRASAAVLLTSLLLLGGAVLWHKAHPRIALQLPMHAEGRCDENGWCTQSPVHAETMRAVWAGAPNDVWTVDTGGSAWQFDGVKWASRYTGMKFPEAVFGFGPKAIWIVGGHQAVFWDGARFVPFDIPVRGALSAVFGTAANDVWASSGAGMLAHWNGQRWSVVETPFTGWLQAIWGAKGDDLWAAGGRTENGPSNVILHYDGHAWTTQEIPCTCDLTGLSGTARDDVWAVGSWGTILHFDGQRWSSVPTPATRGLTGVWASARNDAWAVGEQGMVLHYDGKGWIAAKPDWKWFFGIAGTATGELWAVGQDGWILHFHANHFHGLPKPEPAPADGAAPSTSASEPTPSEPTPSKRLDAESGAALARARKLQSQGEFESAKAAFVQATGHQETVNLRPVAEYAYALLLRDDRAAYDDVESMLLTSTKGDDAELQAQAWFNLALLYGKKSLPEAERAALARSLARREAAVARRKLNGRSSCVAELASRYMTTNARVATGWSGVCSSLGLCPNGQPLTAEQARKRACVTTSGSAGTPDESHGCAGEGPWTSSYGYSMYRFSAAWIAPTSKDRFLVIGYSEGGWQATCAGSTDTSCERSGNYAIVSQRYAGLSALPGRSLPQSGEPDATCLELPELKSTGVYSLSTAELLAAVTVVDSQPVEVSVDPDEKRLMLSGGGCDGYVPLDGSMRWVMAASK